MDSRNAWALWASAATLATAASLSLCEPASAGVWNSVGEADWNTPANWDNGIVPSSGWEETPGAGAPILASGTALFGGADFVVYHEPLTLSGGSLKMTHGVGGNFWIAWGGANSSVTVNAGTLEFWQLFVGSASAPYAPVPENAGTLSVNGGNMVGEEVIINDGSRMYLSGGDVSVGNVFHVRSGSLEMSGGTLSAAGIGFDGGGTRITFSGGQINLQWGIYVDSDGYLDFTDASTGIIHLAGDVSGAGAADLLTTGRVRYMGAVDASAFAVTLDSAGSYIAAVPEPMAGAVILAGSVLLCVRRRRA